MVMNLRARKEHEAKTGGRNVRSLPTALLSQSSRPLLQVYTKCTELPSYLFRDWRERTINAIFRALKLLTRHPDKSQFRKHERAHTEKGR